MSRAFKFFVAFFVPLLWSSQAIVSETCQSSDYQVYLEQIYNTESGQEYLWSYLAPRWSSAFFKHGRLGLNSKKQLDSVVLRFKDSTGKTVKDLRVVMEPSRQGVNYQSIGLDLNEVIERLLEKDSHLLMKVLVSETSDQSDIEEKKWQCIAEQKLLNSSDN